MIVLVVFILELAAAILTFVFAGVVVSEIKLIEDVYCCDNYEVICRGVCVTWCNMV